MSASFDFRAMAAQCLKEAIDAGRLSVQPSDNVLALVSQTWAEARKRSVMTEPKR
jgi:hypothetical protein